MNITRHFSTDSSTTGTPGCLINGGDQNKRVGWRFLLNLINVMDGGDGGSRGVKINGGGGGGGTGLEFQKIC